MTKNEQFRRGFIASAAAAITGAAILKQTPRNTKAQVIANGIRQDNLSVTSDDWVLELISIAPTASISWVAFDEAVEQIRLNAEFEVDGKGPTDDSRVQGQVERRFSVDGGKSGEAEITAEEIQVFRQHDRGHSNDSDSGQTEHSVVINYTLTLENEDGQAATPAEEAVFEDSESFTVTLDKTSDVTVAGTWNADADA